MRIPSSFFGQTFSGSCCVLCDKADSKDLLQIANISIVTQQNYNAFDEANAKVIVLLLFVVFFIRFLCGENICFLCGVLLDFCLYH